MCLGILVENLIQMRSGQFPFVLPCSQTKKHSSHALMLNPYNSVKNLNTILTFRWSQDTGVGIVTRLWVGRLSIRGSILRSGKKILFPRGNKNFLGPHRLCYSPILLSLGSWGQSGMVVNLTTHLYLMQRSGIRRGVEGHLCFQFIIRCF